MCNHTHVDPAAFWRPAYSDKKKKEIDEAKKTEEAVSEEEKEKNKPDGVELVARRDLEPGDEITVSYAIADSDTFSYSVVSSRNREILAIRSSCGARYRKPPPGSQKNSSMLEVRNKMPWPFLFNTLRVSRMPSSNNDVNTF